LPEPVMWHTSSLRVQQELPRLHKHDGRCPVRISTQPLAIQWFYSVVPG
jgi:hypothetical protein